MFQPPKRAIALAVTSALVPAVSLQAGGKGFGRKALAAAVTAAVVTGKPATTGVAPADCLPYVGGCLRAGAYAVVPGAVGENGGALLAWQDPDAEDRLRDAVGKRPARPARAASDPRQARVLEALADYQQWKVSPSIWTFDSLALGWSGPSEFRFPTKAAEALALRQRLDQADGRIPVGEHLACARDLARGLDQFTMTALEEWHDSGNAGRDAILVERLVKIAEYVGLNAEFEAKLSLVLRGRLADQVSGRRPLGKGRTLAQAQADYHAVVQSHAMLTAAMDRFTLQVIPLILDLTAPGAGKAAGAGPETMAAPESPVAGPAPRDPVEQIEPLELR